MEQLLKS